MVRGRCRYAPISATETQLPHWLRTSRYSGSRRRRSAGSAMTWVARSRFESRGLVRPLTSTYSGTKRPAAASSSPSQASNAIGQHARPRRGAEVVADPGHQTAHLVGDHAHVDVLVAEHRETRVLAGRRDEQGVLAV